MSRQIESRSGDELARMVEESVGLARQAALRVARRSDRVEFDEVLSEAMLGLLHAARTYDPLLGSCPRRWADCAARNYALDGLRKWRGSRRKYRVRCVSLSWSDANGEEFGFDPPAPDELSEREDREELRAEAERFLAGLPHRDRTLLRMVYGIGHPESTQADVAEAIGVCPGRVSQMVAEAVENARAVS